MAASKPRCQQKQRTTVVKSTGLGVQADPQGVLVLSMGHCLQQHHNQGRGCSSLLQLHTLLGAHAWLVRSARVLSRKNPVMVAGCHKF